MAHMLGLLTLAVAAASPLEELASIAPALHALHKRAVSEPSALADELRELSASTLAPTLSAPLTSEARSSNSSLPVVLGHGMGDSCFNSGFQSVTKLVGDHLGVYSVCIPTGDNVITDTINGFLLNMDASVDVFAKAVRADPKLAGGFNAIGLSQGNNLIRGYIQKYNDPPVHAYLSICGINAGVAAFPQCLPTIPVVGGACAALTEVLGDLAYLEIIQNHLFQANYFRDPTKLADATYMANSQLAAWNGEGSPGRTNSSLAKHNWAKTEKFVWIRGTLDTVVWPNQAEQWGVVSSDYPANKTVLPMTQANWYLDDPFGLQTASKREANYFEQFAGEHIQMSSAELTGWLDKYFA